MPNYDRALWADGSSGSRYSSGVTEDQKKKYIPLGTNLKKSVTSTTQKLHTMSQVDDARGALMRGVGTGIQGAGKAYNWITEPLKYAAEEGDISPEATLGHLLIGAEKLTKMGGRGAEMWATGADTKLGQLPRREDGQPWVDPDVARTTGEMLTGAALEGGAVKGVQQLGKLTKGLKIVDTLTPSPVAVTADGLRIKPANVTDDLARQSAQPLEARGMGGFGDDKLLPEPSYKKKSVVLKEKYPVTKKGTRSTRPLLEVSPRSILTRIKEVDLGQLPPDISKAARQRNKELLGFEGQLSSLKQELKTATEFKINPKTKQFIIDPTTNKPLKYRKRVQSKIADVTRRIKDLEVRDLHSIRNFYSSNVKKGGVKLAKGFERHHLAGLNWAKPYFKGLDFEDMQSLSSFAREYGVEFGDVLANRKDLLKVDHTKLHVWLNELALDHPPKIPKNATLDQRKALMKELLIPALKRQNLKIQQIEGTLPKGLNINRAPLGSKTPIIPLNN